MEIKFIELLGKTGSKQRALFEVGKQKVIVGVVYSVLSSLGMPSDRDTCTDFLKEFGTLRIQLMIAENNLQEEYTFSSEDRQAMTTQAELRSYLKNKISEAEYKSRRG